MIDLIITALNGAGIDATPSSRADPSRADTAPVVYQLLTQIVGANAYPLKLPQQPALPSAVYQPVARTHIEADEYRLGRVDTYLTSLRAGTFAELQTLSDQMDAVASGYDGPESVDITDAAADYEDDQQQYRAHFELQVTTLATVTPSLPAAFVHAVSSEAAPPATNCRHQTVTEYIAVVLIATQDNIDSVRRNAIGALLGTESPGSITPLEYDNGLQVAVSGRHVYWRELLRWQRRIPT